MTDPTIDRGVPGPGIDAPLFVDHLEGGLDASLRELASRPTILVALDFDGVLAPLVDDPSTSRVTPAAVDAVAQLAPLPGVEVALISGRDATTLVRLAEVPAGVRVVGSHGAEPGRTTTAPNGEPAFDGEPLALSQAQSESYAEVLRTVTALVADHPGARVETKPAAVVVHTRGTPAEEAEEIHRAVLAGPATIPGLRVQRGKDVVELAVLHVSKGDAVTDLRADTVSDAVLFIGDDLTDEDAFAVLGPDDLGIKVGDGETEADYRITDPDAVAAVLLRLVELRTGR
ncbi:trehalose-phosphatase [Georgenia sunbinii]|uniref:trehalose-phosphatase n=1 Tax=Georgenia sunbinii TaxID=3117728 RepID=UPI002F268F86